MSFVAPLRTGASLFGRRSAPAFVTLSRPSTVARLFSNTALREDKKFSQSHEWVSFTDKKSVTIGITSYASGALGDVVYVELPAVGDSFGAGDTIGAVESVKSASDIVTPVAGTVSEVNVELEEKPGIVNQDPEGEGAAGGWMFRLDVEDAEAQTADLLDKPTYDSFVEESKDSDKDH